MNRSGAVRARGWGLLVALCVSAHAMAAPATVEHAPGAQVFGEPGGVTGREPEIVRESDAVALWVRIGPSFTYDRVAVYYTTDGSAPVGAFGAPGGSSSVLTSLGGQVTFVRNEPAGGGGNNDWWVVTLPASARTFGTAVRYTVSAWQNGEGTEVFASGGAAFEFTNLLAWPGAGAGMPNPSEGYPQLWFWKEEAVAGNNYINVMLDQNGSLYDVYYPSPGAVNGVSTKNEGYSDGGQDQFPPFLSPDQRGQMHLNQAFLGVRPTNPADGSGVTYWLTNANGTDYTGVSQEWAGDTNVVSTAQTLVGGGVNIGVQQFDFSPRGVIYPTWDDAVTENRGLFVKRVILTNHGGSAAELNVYFFADFALNGGDGFDGTFADSARGAMVAFDNTQRLVNGAGEYNPSTFSDYEKNTSVYLAAAMKTAPSVGGAGGTPAQGLWSDTSSDQGRGWIGSKVTLAPGESKELSVAVVGGFDPFAGATGTYDFQVDGALDWFLSGNMSAEQAATEASWTDWLAVGVQFDSPDAAYDALFKRGLLGTALHLDGENGGIIAGMHNGAYPYVWPRDAAWAAITLARTGFLEEARGIYGFLRDIAYRDVDGWGRKGFWKQKYSTDGYTIWGNPQVDETSCYPWGVKYIFDVTGDLSFLEEHYDEVYEAGLASSQTSTFDNRMRYDETFDLMDSMSLWEDAFGLFNYSNASVIRGLEDAAAIADVLDQQVCPGGPGMCGYHADRALFESRAVTIRGGLDARLAWNGENTDISQLGITYPFEVYAAGSARPQLVLDRINGFQSDAFGNFQPLVRGPGIPEWQGMVDRYWGDGYWNGGPWFLTTLWFGAYHALRQDVSPGTEDIDVHKEKIDLMIGALGPMGFGAEQIAPDSTVKYAGQTDYRLQTAYPNAWESMSFLTDAVMLFLGWTPDAAGNTLRLRPKLPSDWAFVEYSNIAMGAHRLGVRVAREPKRAWHELTNETGAAVNFETVVRFAPGEPVCAVLVNGAPAAHTVDAGIGAVTVSGAMATGAGAVTSVQVFARPPADVSGNGVVDFNDIAAVLADWLAVVEAFSGGDTNGDGVVDFNDITAVLGSWLVSCP